MLIQEVLVLQQRPQCSAAKRIHLNKVKSLHAQTQGLQQQTQCSAAKLSCCMVRQSAETYSMLCCQKTTSKCFVATCSYTIFCRDVSMFGCQKIMFCCQHLNTVLMLHAHTQCSAAIYSMFCCQKATFKVLLLHTHTQYPAATYSIFCCQRLHLNNVLSYSMYCTFIFEAVAAKNYI